MADGKEHFVRVNPFGPPESIPTSDRISDQATDIQTQPEVVVGFQKEDLRLSIPFLSKGIEAGRKRGRSDKVTFNYLKSKDVPDHILEQLFDSAIVNPAIFPIGAILPLPRRKPRKVDIAQERATDLAGLYHNLLTKHVTTVKSIGGIANEDLAASARKDTIELNTKISEKLLENGITTSVDKDSGQLMIADSEGNLVPLEPSMMESILNAKFETTGAIGGTILGNRVSPQLGFTLGAIGAGLGRGADLFWNSYKLGEEISGKFYIDEMINAAIYDSAVTVTGSSLMYGFSKSRIPKALHSAYDLVFKGRVDGARRALQDFLQLSDSEITSNIKQWEVFNKTDAPGKTLSEKGIATTVLTDPNADIVVKSALSSEPKTSFKIRLEVDKRAKDLKESAKNLTVENTGKVIQVDLKNYIDDVNNLFRVTRREASDVIDKTDFFFSVKELGVVPLLKNMQKRIVNPTTQRKLLRLVQDIDKVSQARSFSALLDLRQAVGKFGRSSDLQEFADKKAVGAVISRIDSKIAEAATKILPDGQAWLRRYTVAKKEFAQMKRVEENTLFKSITKPEASEQSIRRDFVTYINSLGPVFTEVADKIPQKTVVKAEGAIIDELISKYTTGKSSELQAVHFPMLSDQLSYMKFRSTKVKNLVDSVHQMAQIYRTDQNLSKLSAKITGSEAQSFYTSSPATRSQIVLNNRLFKFIMKSLPGEKGRDLSLLSKVQNLLKEPLNQKITSDFLKELPEEEILPFKSLVETYQTEVAKQNAKRPIQEIPSRFGFKVTSGTDFEITDGLLGKGVYLDTTVKNAREVALTKNILKTEVEPGRLATAEMLESFAGKPVDAKFIRDNPQMIQELEAQGFQGLFVGDKIMLFKRPQSINIVRKNASVAEEANKTKTTSELKEVTDKAMKDQTSFEIEGILNRLEAQVNGQKGK